MRVRGKGLPAPDRETPTVGGWRPRLCYRVKPVMAQLCGLRRCWALLALLASLLLFRAEAADGERDVHGEGPEGSPGRGGWPRVLRQDVRGRLWGGKLGSEGPLARSKRGELAGGGEIGATW